MTKVDNQLTGDEIAALRARAEKHGGNLKGAAEDLGLPRTTLATALAGGTLRAGTLLLIRTRLAAAEAT
jgi:hypothetical protein